VSTTTSRELHAALVDALERFLDDVVALRGEIERSHGQAVQPFTDAPGLAELLVNLPSCRAADAAAEDAAAAAQYILPSPTRKRSGTSRTAGRSLSAATLVRMGLAGGLLHGLNAERSVIARQLAEFLAGPVVPIWEYVVLDADLHIRGPIPLADQWELVTPTSEELRSLLPVPSAAAFQPERPFDLSTYGGLAMLRRIDQRRSPHSGHRIYLPPNQPALQFWQPLLALGLYRDDVLHLWAQYIVEPGRSVETCFRDVPTEPWDPDGEVELPRRGTYEIASHEEAHFRRFLSELAPSLLRASAPPVGAPKGSQKAAERLRRIAEHFLVAGSDAYEQGNVLSEHNAESALHYVIALEALLAGGDSERLDFSRKTSQRAAILAGEDDAQRLATAEVIKAAYDARSTYAHGAEPPQVDLPRLRSVVRACILTRLIVGDPVAEHGDLSKVADDALLSGPHLENHIRRPVREFWERVGTVPSAS
jgi:hypothetical protein